MSTRKIWKFWWNFKNTLQWKVPAQFDPSINLHPKYNYGYGNMSNPILYSFLAQSCIDDSINLILETISNIITLIKDFLNHHLTEIGWMLSPLTKSDRFLVDLLITFIYNSPFPVSTPYMTQCHDWVWTKAWVHVHKVLWQSQVIGLVVQLPLWESSIVMQLRLH